MDLLISFILFIISMIACLVTGYSVVYALLIGFICFFITAVKRGYPAKDVFNMARNGISDSMIVVGVMVIIGILTGLWRASGTISIFIYYGSKIISDNIFIIVTFLMACLLSYALGTSFGVCGTLGIIFMALARSGNADEIITAGAIISGIYFGDRCSPVSSSAHLVAASTKTDIYENIKYMFKTCYIPFAITLVIYIFLSFRYPIESIDEEILNAITDNFTLSLWCFAPAIIMLVLPLAKIDVKQSMGFSALAAAVVAISYQDMTFTEVVKCAVMGFEAPSGSLSSILDGGGIISMVKVCLILAISCSYSGIFDGTGMLENVQSRITDVMGKWGRFPAMVMVSILSLFIFCNQTIGILMCSNLLKEPYIKAGGSNLECAIDMENSVIVICAVIPWALACSVPLAMLQVPFKAVFFAFYVWLIPVCYFFTKRIWFKEKA